MSALNADSTQTSSELGRLLEQLIRLGIDIDFTLLGTIEILRSISLVNRGDLSDVLRVTALTEADLSEEDLLAATRDLASGEFVYDLVAQFILGLASALGPERIGEILGLDERDVEPLFDDGHLIAREGANTFATPSWLIDTSQPDGLIHGSRDILAEDAPCFPTTFGNTVFHPRHELLAIAPMAPERWLGEGYGVEEVLHLLGAFPPEAKAKEGR